MKKKLLLLAAGLSLFALPSHLLAQDATSVRRFSLNEAVDFALKNNVNIKNAQLDALSANARVGEIRAIGLPQVSAQAQLLHNIVIQNVILESGKGPSFGADPNQPPLPEGTVVAFPFQLKNLGGVTLNANQLLFDGSYFVGLKAAKTYKELSTKSLTASKIDVTEAVTKAYYSVLVNRDRLKLLDINVGRLDTVLRETRAMYENGFVEKIDLDRLEVQLNNLNTEKQKVERLAELGDYLLKFQMGLAMTERVALTDSISRNALDNFAAPVVSDFNYNQRIEYSLLQTQRELANLDIKNSRAGYLPQLAAFGTFGYNPAASRLGNILQKKRWLDYSFVGLQLNVPIFDGLQKYYKVQQSRLAYQKTEQSQQLLENSIDLQIRQAVTTLTNALETLKSQQRNMDLAREVERVTRIKYQQGVGSNLEVVTAVSDYREAETNYYTALYDALIARIDYQKATGTLLQP
jgi:outer membrane protein TolC